MFVLFLVLTLLSVVLLIIGWISPQLVVRWGKHRTRLWSTAVYGIPTLVFAILLLVTSMNRSTSYSDLAAWNTSDMNAASNGNIKIAAQWLQLSSENSRSGAQSPQTSAVFQKPWEYYGQVVKVSGTVARIEAHLSGSESRDLGDAASEMVIRAKDGTYVDFLMPVSSGQIRVGDTVSIYGYPVGHGSAAMGTKNSDLVLVGNAVDDPAK